MKAVVYLLLITVSCESGWAEGRQVRLPPAQTLIEEYISAKKDSQLLSDGDLSSGPTISRGSIHRLIDIFSNLTKEQKLMVTNVAGVAVIAAVGLASWDYGSSSFKVKSEGWLGEDTKYGGADKVGHYWGSYAFADVLGSLYRTWGFTNEEAALYSSLSSWVVMGMMEIGDSFSAEHGFSIEDLTMNTLGALTSFFLQHYPEIDRYFDLRVQYDFNVTPEDILTDYDNLSYLVALNLSAFKRFENSILRYFELQLGYRARGYTLRTSEGQDQLSRELFVGVSLNFTELIFGRKSAKSTENPSFVNRHEQGIRTLFRYIQPPQSTFLIMSHDLNR